MATQEHAEQILNLYENVKKLVAIVGRIPYIDDELKTLVLEFKTLVDIVIDNLETYADDELDKIIKGLSETMQEIVNRLREEVE